MSAQAAISRSSTHAPLTPETRAVLEADGCGTSGGRTALAGLPQPLARSQTWHPPGPLAIWRHPVPHLPHWHQRTIMKSILAALRHDVVSVHGFERLSPENDPFIVALNHSTRLEALLLPCLLAFHRRGHLVSFIADWNFALIPGIATILRAGESILLVRKPAKPALLNVFRPWFERRGPAFERAAQALRSGRSVGIFPEGTTNRHPSRLLRGFDGAARLSLTTGVPVVPVGIRFPGHPAHRPVPDRTPMELHVGEALRPSVAQPTPDRETVRDWHSRIMRELAHLSGKSWEQGSTRRKHHGFE